MARTVPDWVRRKGGLNTKVGIKHGFRSGLEDTLAGDIKAAGEPVHFETIKIDYVVPESWHKYTPDFPLRNGIIVEGKGIFDAQDRAKHLYIKAQYPELDIRFVFSRSKAPIGPGAKSTMADWCTKWGFKYSEKHIPKEWFLEPGPAKKPEEVLKAGPFGFVKAAKTTKARK